MRTRDMLQFEESTLDNFVRHVLTLYQCTSNNERMSSVKWLERFQTREEAWSICYGALSSHHDCAVKHYAVVILRNKIDESAQYIALDYVKGIYEFFTQYLRTHAPQMKIAQEICIAIAHLCAKSTAWNMSFMGVVKDLAAIPKNNENCIENNVNGINQGFSSASKDYYSPESAVIVFLHEYFYIVKRIPNNRKRIILTGISENWDMLISTMNHLFNIYQNPQSSTDYEYLIKLILIFTKIQNVMKNKTYELFRSSLFQNILHITKINDSNMLLFDACASNICFFFNYLKTDELVTDELYKFFMEYSMSFDKNIQRAISDFNLDYLTSILDILSNLAERFFPLYLESNYENDYSFIRISFQICSVSDYKVLMNFLHFWEDFRKFDGRFDSNPKFKCFTKKYCDMLVKLILKILPISDSLLNKSCLFDEDNKDLCDFREIVLDVFKYVLRYVSCDIYYNEILLLFTDQNSKQFSILEASIIFVWGMIYQNFDLNYEIFLRCIANLPHDSPPYLLKTACGFINDFISKLSRFERQRYNFIVDFLYFCLKRPSIQAEASDALNICVSSGMDENNSLEILHTINTIIYNTSDSGNYDSLVCLFACKFSGLNVPNKDKILLDICSSQLREVIVMIEKNIAFTNSHQSDSIEILGTFFKELVTVREDSFNYYPVIDQIINVIFAITDFAYQNETVCERSCRLLKHIFKFATINYNNLESISLKLIESFKKSGYSSFVYTFHSLYEMYSPNKNLPDWLDNHFHILMDLVFNQFQDTSPKENPFLVEDFMRLCRRAFATNDYKVLLLPCIERVISIASIGLSSSQRPTFKASYNLIFNIFNPDLFKKSIKDSNVVRSALIHLYESRFPPIIKNCVDIIFSKMSLQFVEMCGSLLHRIILFEKAYSNAQQLASTQTLGAECRRFVTQENYNVINSFIEKIPICDSYREAGKLAEELSKDLFGY